MRKCCLMILLLILGQMLVAISPKNGEDPIRLLKRFRNVEKVDKDDARPRIGLVLSGGGALGLAHIGVLQALEEIGIKPDYVTGTSMGAIIGGLYAIGYDPYQLEQLSYDIDWDAALSDEIPRSSVPFEEKSIDAAFPFVFPIEGFGIKLPQGLLTGQKLYEILTRLTVATHHISDFNQLPIPFLCIATDIESGKPVILDKGYLPDAMRASMSIPSMFIPIKLNGKTLVDGGLSCNLPAEYVSAMGADIVIAVDVSGNMATEDELDSFLNILAQTISFHSINCLDEQLPYVDVYIEPKLPGYNFMDFQKSDSLIAHGINAVFEQYSELKAIVEEQKKYPAPPEQEKLVVPDAIYISEITSEGLDQISEKVVLASLQIEPDTWVTTKDIEEAIDRLYGTRYFELVNYRLSPAEDGVVLIIKAIEKKSGELRAGVNYNSDLKAALMLNLSFKNLLLDGSRLSFDLKLSDNYAWNTEYFYYPGWEPGLGLKGSINGESFDIWLYGEDGQRYAFYDYEMYGQQFTVQTVNDNRITAGLGIELFQSEMDLKARTVEYFPDEIKSSFIDYFGFLNADTYDRSVFPRDGIEFYIEARGYYGIMDYGSGSEDEQFHFKRYYGRTRNIFPIKEKWSFLLNAYSGGVVGDQVPDEFDFFLGGQHYHESRFIPMLGLDWMHKVGKCALSYDMGIRYEAWKNIFLAGRIGAGKACNEYTHLFTKADGYLAGYGLSIGAKTPIGPVELMIMDGTSDSGKMEWYVQIGSDFR